MMKNKKEMRLAGSYTIEAALLMGIILPLLVGIIYMGFFLHDRGFLQAAAYEVAVYASLHADDNGMDMTKAAQTLTAGRMLGIRTVLTESTVGEHQVDVAYRGQFQVPGMIQRFFDQRAITVRSGVTLTLERPSKRIQKIRGIANIVNAVRRNRE